MDGVIPEYVDHKDRIRHNNVWSNLRKATSTDNNRNVGLRSDNPTGYKGVRPHKSTGMFQAYAYLNTVYIDLGLYPTPQQASTAYQDFAKENHGQFYLSQ